MSRQLAKRLPVGALVRRAQMHRDILVSLRTLSVLIIILSPDPGNYRNGACLTLGWTRGGEKTLRAVRRFSGLPFLSKSVYFKMYSNSAIILVAF